MELELVRDAQYTIVLQLTPKPIPNLSRCHQLSKRII